VDAALGTDTGGSVREPASYCGVVGFKPSFGALSPVGCMPNVIQFDQIGIIARDADVCRRIFDVMSSDRVRTSAMEHGFYSRIAGKKIGIAECSFHKVVHPDIKAAVVQAGDKLASAGMNVYDVRLESLYAALAAYQAIATAEILKGFSSWERLELGSGAEATGFDRSRLGYEVKRRIIMGDYIRIYDKNHLVQRAKLVQARIKAEFSEAFKHVDMILTPTTPTTATRMHEPGTVSQRSDIFTAGVNLAGLPAISIPFERDGEGMPIGIQLIGPAGSDSRLLGMAQSIGNILCGE